VRVRVRARVKGYVAIYIYIYIYEISLLSPCLSHVCLVHGTVHARKHASHMSVLGAVLVLPIVLLHSSNAEVHTLVRRNIRWILLLQTERGKTLPKTPQHPLLPGTSC
jgi:hypothetical protein